MGLVPSFLARAVLVQTPVLERCHAQRKFCTATVVYRTQECVGNLLKLNIFNIGRQPV